MAGNDSKIVEKLKRENKSKQKGLDDPYVKIVINRRLQRMLFTICLMVFFAYLFILNNAQLAGTHWIISSLPIVGLGFMMIFFPPVEEWEYVPWQTAARQYEKHQVERY